MNTKIAITFLTLLPFTGFAQDTQFYQCNGPVVVVPADSEANADGYPLVKLNEPGDGVYNLRFYRPVKVISAKALDENNDECAPMLFWHRTNSWCDAQYFWREPCDTTWLRAQNLINQVVAQGTEFAGRSFDVYSKVHVHTLSDTLWSAEVHRYRVVWNTHYHSLVERDRLKKRLILNELDTTKKAAKEIMAFRWPDDVYRYEPLPRGFAVDYQYARFEPFGDQFQVYPLTFDPRSLAMIEPEVVLGPNAREIIYEAVCAFTNDHPELRINTYHYQPELKRMILFTVKPDHCVVHIGEEGEFRGVHTVRIPL